MMAPTPQVGHSIHQAEQSRQSHWLSIQQISDAPFVVDYAAQRASWRALLALDVTENVVIVSQHRAFWFLLDAFQRHPLLESLISYDRRRSQTDDLAIIQLQVDRHRHGELMHHGFETSVGMATDATHQVPQPMCE